MTKRFLIGLCAVLALTFVSRPFAQEREDRTLLSHDQMRAIISEASGERAMHHVLELVPYPRIRPTAEYQGHFQESDVMARFGLSPGPEVGRRRNRDGQRNVLTCGAQAWPFPANSPSP